jgi:hypothetical protein
MSPRATNGAAQATVDTGTNDIQIDVLDFDPTAEEGATFVVALPGRWDRGNVKVKFFWMSVVGTANVVWGIRARAVSNGEVIDGAYGTQQLVTDDAGTAGTLRISDATAALTIGNTPAIGDLVAFEVTREAANGSDTLNSNDARLIGVYIQYLEGAASVAC